MHAITLAELPHVWMPPQPPPREVWLTKADVSRLMDAAQMPHIRLYVVLAVTTAARMEALLTLTWDRVDLDAGIIDLRDRGDVGFLGKRSRPRVATAPEMASGDTNVGCGVLLSQQHSRNRTRSARRQDSCYGPLARIIVDDWVRPVYPQVRTI